MMSAEKVPPEDLHQVGVGRDVQGEVTVKHLLEPFKAHHPRSVLEQLVVRIRAFTRQLAAVTLQRPHRRREEGIAVCKVRPRHGQLAQQGLPHGVRAIGRIPSVLEDGVPRRRQRKRPLQPRSLRLTSKVDRFEGRTLVRLDQLSQTGLAEVHGVDEPQAAYAERQVRLATLLKDGDFAISKCVDHGLRKRVDQRLQLDLLNPPRELLDAKRSQLAAVREGTRGFLLLRPRGSSRQSSVLKLCEASQQEVPSRR